MTKTSAITVTTPVITSTHTFHPVADAFVAAPLPDGNWGTGEHLQTKVTPGFDSYLRFDVQGITDPIKQATLRIYVEDFESIGFDSHVVTDTTWTETGITYNNAPPIGEVITSSGTVTGSTWAVLDVTQYITTVGEYNLALTSPNDNTTRYSSREGSHPPELIIDTSDQSSPVFVDFYAVPVTGTVLLTVIFTNLSENTTGYLWEFGDGVTSTLAAPVHAYAQTGAYTVTLTGTGPGRQDSEVKAGYITVLDILTPTNTPTPTNAPTAVNTPTASPTLMPTSTPTNTPAPTATYTPTVTSTHTAAPTSTNTPPATAANTPTAAPTFTPTPTVTSGPPLSETIGINPVVNTVEIGDLFTVTVEMVDLETAVTGYQFDLTYDSALLQLENVEGGTFFANAGQDTVCPAWVEPTANSMRLACVGVGPTVGVTGNGRLATLTFTALGSGQSDLTLSAIQLPDTDVPPVNVKVSLQHGLVMINDNTSGTAVLMDETDSKGTGGISTAAWWLVLVQDVDETAVIVTIALFILLAALLYLDRQRQLRYIWRVLISLSLLLQMVVYVPQEIRAAEIKASATGEIERETNLRHTENLAPPIRPIQATSQGCYDADLDCDEDVDEADVNRASYSWDCDNLAACYDLDADIDDNNIIDVLDLARITNDYDIVPPEITITAPAEGTIVTGANLTVSGQLADAHDIGQVTVNGQVASLAGNAFTVQLPLETGNDVLDVVAEDVIGLTSIAGRVVMADQNGPVIKIDTPADGQAVYTDVPDVVVNYDDFLADVDTTSFTAELKDSTNTTIQTFDHSVAAADSAQFTLVPLALGQSYTLTALIADEHGNTSLTRSSFYVTPYTAITPPVVPERPAWISGHVYDSSTCNEHLTTCSGLEGARVTLMQVDPDALETVRSTRADVYESLGTFNGAFPPGNADMVNEFATEVAGTVFAGPDGFYAFPVDTTGHYHLRIERDGYTYGQREVAAVRERSTAVNGIYLTPIDAAATLCGSIGCSHTSADGQMTVEIPAGAIPDGEQVEVTATEFDRVYFLPSGQLPPETAETYAFNLGGESDYEFLQPVTVKLKNSLGFVPGTEIPLGYWNQHTQQWEHVSVGIVDETGEWLVMEVTHFSNFDCNDPVVWPSEVTSTATSRTGNETPCSDGEEGCFISLKSGSLREWVNLPTVPVAGDAYAPGLVYNTSRANPSAMIDVQFDLYFNVQISLEDYIQYELFIEGVKSEVFTLAADANGEGEVGRFRYLWDGRNAVGEQVPSGVYEYAVRLSVPYRSEWYWTLNGRFGGPPDPNLPTGIFRTGYIDEWVYGKVTINPQQETPYGAGWVLQGQQFLHEDEAGRITVIQDDTLTQFYLDEIDLLHGEDQYTFETEAQPPVVSPAAVNFPVAGVSGGTNVSGLIDTNTTWTAAASPYIVQDDDMTVAAGVTLTIEPGTQVLLDHSRNMIVEGSLNAIGTTTNPITFTAHYDSQAGTEHFQTYSYVEDDIGLSNVTAVAIDAVGNTWLAGNTRDADYNYVAAIEQFQYDLISRQLIFLPAAYENSVVRDLAIDASDRKWVATDQGVFRLESDNTTWTLFVAAGSGLLSDDVNTIEIATDGTIWFGLHGGGVQILSAAGTTWTSYDSGSSGLLSDIVNDIGFDSQGNTWIGTTNGLNRFDPVTNVWIPYSYTYPGSINIPSTNAITQLDIDLDDQVWALVGADVACLSVADGLWTNYAPPPSGPEPDLPTTIVIDNAGQKWVGYKITELTFVTTVRVLSPDNTTWIDKSEFGISTVEDMAGSPITGDIWIGRGSESVVRNYLTGSLYDGTVIGGYWGSLQITGAADLEHVTLEMGGGDKQSSLRFMNTPAPITAANLTVRAGGGAGVDVENSDVTFDNVTVLANRGNGLRVGPSGTVTLNNAVIQQNKRAGIHLEANASVSGTDATVAYNQVAFYTTDESATIALNTLLIEGNEGTTRWPLQTNIDTLTWQNNRANDVEWLGGVRVEDGTWMHSPGIENHWILDDITVDASTIHSPSIWRRQIRNGRG